MAEFVVAAIDDRSRPKSYRKGDLVKARKNGWRKRALMSDTFMVVQFPFLSLREAKAYCKTYMGPVWQKRLFYYVGPTKPFSRRFSTKRWIRSR